MSSIGRELQGPLNTNCRGMYVDGESREVGRPSEAPSAAPGTVQLTACPDAVTFPEVAGIVAANGVPFAKKPLIVI